MLCYKDKSMVKQIVGGVITLVIGGTAYTVSQSTVANNFSKNTGMNQQQSQKYVSDAQNNLKSFSKIGSDLVADGDSIVGAANKVDCANYTYTWETPSLTCDQGVAQLQIIGKDEIKLGNSYSSLGTNLGSAGRSTISDCIGDIDTVDADYNMPIAAQFMKSSEVKDLQNSNLYNKSVLQTALESK
jgi:hypothetical protein